MSTYQMRWVYYTDSGGMYNMEAPGDAVRCGSWSTLTVLRETVGRVRVGMLLLRWRRCNLLMMLMYNARGSRLLEMVRRWRPLLMGGMMLHRINCQ